MLDSLYLVGLTHLLQPVQPGTLLAGIMPHGVTNDRWRNSEQRNADRRRSEQRRSSDRPIDQPPVDQHPVDQRPVDRPRADRPPANQPANQRANQPAQPLSNRRSQPPSISPTASHQPEFSAATLPLVPSLGTARSPNLTAPNPLSAATLQAARLPPLPLDRFSPPAPLPRPRSGSQLYQQRLAALRDGEIYTRLAPHSFQSAWHNATAQPTYEDWLALLAAEARAMAQMQGEERLSVLLGDSIAQWFPPEALSSDRLWLNQGISGDTTAGVLRRVAALDHTDPDSIHLMAGVNDLKTGVADRDILANLTQIIQQLKTAHPQSQIYIYSILPTRRADIPSDRVQQLNAQIAAVAAAEQVQFLDLQTAFGDAQGNLRPDLTTDGLHLNPLGYETWRSAMALAQ